MARAYLVFVMGVLLTGRFHDCTNAPLRELTNIEIKEEHIAEGRVEPDIFVEAEKITGCPAEILRGIAGTESRFLALAVGDTGQSCGMFQLHSRWHDSRVERYGEFDPFAPADAAIIAGYIIQENLRSFDGDLRLAIAAYRQGVAGVNQNGAADWYVDAILNWRECSEKVLSFYIFQGITEPVGRNGNGHYGFRAQVVYQPRDSVTSPVSRRGSSGFPY